jgi:hypothetical protein
MWDCERGCVHFGEPSPKSSNIVLVQFLEEIKTAGPNEYFLDSDFRHQNWFFD